MCREKLFKNIINNYQNQKTKIVFQEEPTSGYKTRTIKNASADATIAFATDFSTSGEKLTHESVLNQGKKYIGLNVNDISESNKSKMIEFAIEELNKVNAKTLNIAGNRIFTMKGKYNQQQVDDLTFEILHAIITSPNLITPIELIRSGGQTGFDEAGIKAAVKLNIPALVLAPKNWTFRDITDIDKYDEVEFKKRFDTI